MGCRRELKAQIASLGQVFLHVENKAIGKRFARGLFEDDPETIESSKDIKAASRAASPSPGLVNGGCGFEKIHAGLEQVRFSGRFLEQS
jgi:hypothetical protein